MIHVDVTFTDGTTRVLTATEQAKAENMKDAAHAIRKDAKSAIKRAPKDVASPEGQAPHTHRGAFFSQALWAAVGREDALIGFRHSKIGEVAHTHEHGEEEEGRDYPVRPTMLPALERNLGRFHHDWRASIG